MSFKSPEDAVQTIGHCTPQSCSEIGKGLALAFPIDLPCDVAVLDGPFETNANDAVLKINCTGDFALVLLREGKNRTWVNVNSISFPQGDIYSRLTANVRNIESVDTKDVLVEHLIGSHGTGFLEEYFLVFRVVDGHLRTVLEVIQHFVRSGWSGVPDVDEQSTFTFDAPTSKQPGDIVEHLVISAGELPRISLEQGFAWDGFSKIYSPDGWDTVKLGSHPH